MNVRTLIAVALVAVAGPVLAQTSAPSTSAKDAVKADKEQIKKDKAQVKADHKAGNKDAIGSRESDYGAEAAYFFVNETIEKEWDAVGNTPKIKYEGDATAVVKKLEADDKKRLKYISELEDINKIYVSPKWFPVVLGWINRETRNAVGQPVPAIDRVAIRGEQQQPMPRDNGVWRESDAGDAGQGVAADVFGPGIRIVNLKVVKVCSGR